MLAWASATTCSSTSAPGLVPTSSQDVRAQLGRRRRPVRRRRVGDQRRDLVADLLVLEGSRGRRRRLHRDRTTVRSSHQLAAAMLSAAAAMTNRRAARLRRIGTLLPNVASYARTRDQRPCPPHDAGAPSVVADDAVAGHAASLRLVRRSRRVLHRVVRQAGDVPHVWHRLAPGLRGLRARGGDDQRHHHARGAGGGCRGGRDRHRRPTSRSFR